MQEARFRLRNYHHIVGYRRMHGLRAYFSKDGLWWNGDPLHGFWEDAWTGLKDRNNKYLYVQDIVEFEPTEGSGIRLGVLEQRGSDLGIRCIEDDILYPLNAFGFPLFHGRELRWISYLFLQDR